MLLSLYLFEEKFCTYWMEFAISQVSHCLCRVSLVDNAEPAEWGQFEVSHPMPAVPIRVTMVWEMALTGSCGKMAV